MPDTTPSEPPIELGCRCAWCDAILRLPRDGTEPGDQMWTHGICRPCYARVAAEAAGDPQASRTGRTSPPSLVPQVP